MLTSFCPSEEAFWPSLPEGVDMFFKMEIRNETSLSNLINNSEVKYEKKQLDYAHDRLQPFLFPFILQLPSIYTPHNI